MNILVMDAQGGGIGRQLVSGIRQALPEVTIMAVGANSIATDAMLRAGADAAATGENSVLVACRKADIIVGPIGIVIADSMLGEITPAMAAAVGQSSARRILIPFRNCDNIVVGLSEQPMRQLIQDAIAEIKNFTLQISKSMLL